ncbi:hypothetical protein T492DRAFT_873594 [Pavlovales sp. CCMP2436]|nr:hypothetical protein T492DRAFT_873594 [Pavlovales sp. CCMP2436]
MRRHLPQRSHPTHLQRSPAAVFAAVEVSNAPSAAAFEYGLEPGLAGRFRERHCSSGAADNARCAPEAGATPAPAAPAPAAPAAPAPATPAPGATTGLREESAAGNAAGRALGSRCGCGVAKESGESREPHAPARGWTDAAGSSASIAGGKPDPGAAATAVMPEGRADLSLHVMDLRNLEMEEYCPPLDLLDMLEELKTSQHLDKLTELDYDDVDDFENVDITRFETACTGGGIPPAHIDKLVRSIRKRRLCQPQTMLSLPDVRPPIS